MLVEKLVSMLTIERDYSDTMDNRRYHKKAA